MAFRPPPAVPRYAAFRPADEAASKAARGSSRKSGTRCERLLLEKLLNHGFLVESHAEDLPGKPDLVLREDRVAIFVDGDFWHGRDLDARLERLRRGHNPDYWTAKILRNVQRDREVSTRLEAMAWRVLRFWEGDLRRDAGKAVIQVTRSLLVSDEVSDEEVPDEEG